jgi:hypothetical protein
MEAVYASETLVNFNIFIDIGMRVPNKKPVYADIYIS